MSPHIALCFFSFIHILTQPTKLVLILLILHIRVITWDIGSGCDKKMKSSWYWWFYLILAIFIYLPSFFRDFIRLYQAQELNKNGGIVYGNQQFQRGDCSWQVGQGSQHWHQASKDGGDAMDHVLPERAITVIKVKSRRTTHGKNNYGN